MFPSCSWSRCAQIQMEHARPHQSCIAERLSFDKSWKDHPQSQCWQLLRLNRTSRLLPRQLRTRNESHHRQDPPRQTFLIPRYAQTSTWSQFWTNPCQLPLQIESPQRNQRWTYERSERYQHWTQLRTQHHEQRQKHIFVQRRRKVQTLRCPRISGQSSSFPPRRRFYPTRNPLPQNIRRPNEIKHNQQHRRPPAKRQNGYKVKMRENVLQSRFWNRRQTRSKYRCAISQKQIMISK